MTDQLLLLSGPNLDQLGTRSPEVYGHATLDDHVERLSALARSHDMTVRHLQSNYEGDLIEAIRDARGVASAIIINAAALTHSSWALADALSTFTGVKVEVHLSNPAAREPYRHLSTIAGVVDGTIAGFGALSYDLALDAVVHLLAARSL